MGRYTPGFGIVRNPPAFNASVCYAAIALDRRHCHRLLRLLRAVAAVFAALEILELEGPALGRPLVDMLEGSAISNLKELRPASPGASEIRILFAFDVVRKAVMLVAGNKAAGRNRKAKWNGWYKTAIPQAEEIFRRHQKRIGGDDDGRPEGIS